MPNHDSLLAAAERVASLLTDRGINAVVIGAAALAAHRYVRHTEDIDLGVNIAIRDLDAVAAWIRDAGYDVEVREPDGQDPLGGVLDFLSGSGQSVTLTGDLGMSFAHTSPRGSSLQFHVMAVYLPVPIVTVDVAPGQVTEDDGQKLVYTFTRPIATASDLVVSYSVGGGAIAGDDYTGLPFGSGTQTITIPANQPSATLEVLPTAGKDALHLLNAWSSDLQVCLGQVAVDEGSNEIKAVPKHFEPAGTDRSSRDAGCHALPEGDRAGGMG